MDATRPAFYRPLHLLAWLTTLCVFPLIFMGGLVTSHKAGLAVPDWPNSYGYNMFLFPVSLWTGGIFYEHTHRLLGTLVGFCSILLVFQAYAPAGNARKRRWIGWATIAGALVSVVLGSAMLLSKSSAAALGSYTGPLSHTVVGVVCLTLILAAAWLSRRREERPWVRRLTIVILVAIIAQGILGGLRVDLVNLYLAIIHGCFAQAVFCLCALMIVITSKRWLTPLPARNEPRATSILPRLAVLTLVLIYLQLIVGATMRHFDAGLAIPDFPLSYGHLVPPTSAAALPAINTLREDLDDPRLHPVTMFQIWIHFSHRVGAVVVTAAIVTLVTVILRRHRRTMLLAPAMVLSGLLLLQIALGILSVEMRKPAEIATSHVACGALVLVITFVIAARSIRLYRSPIVPQDEQQTTRHAYVPVPA